MEAMTKISKKTPKTKRPQDKIEYRLVTSLKKTPVIMEKNKKYTIGRNKKNSIIIPQNTTSEVQCSIKWVKSTFKVKDEKSTNGTIVNGKRIKAETALKDGDKINVGKYTIKYVTKKIRIKKD